MYDILIPLSNELWVRFVYVVFNKLLGNLVQTGLFSKRGQPF